MWCRGSEEEDLLPHPNNGTWEFDEGGAGTCSPVQCVYDTRGTYLHGGPRCSVVVRCDAGGTRKTASGICVSKNIRQGNAGNMCHERGRRCSTI